MANADGKLFDPASTIVTIGGGPCPHPTKTGTINDIMLYNGKLESASCHDVHNMYMGGTYYLKITKNGSKICLACHNK